MSVLKKAQSEAEGRVGMEEQRRLWQMPSPDSVVPDARAALGFGAPREASK